MSSIFYFTNLTKTTRTPQHPQPISKVTCANRRNTGIYDVNSFKRNITFTEDIIFTRNKLLFVIYLKGVSQLPPDIFRNLLIYSLNFKLLLNNFFLCILINAINNEKMLKFVDEISNLLTTCKRSKMGTRTYRCRVFRLENQVPPNASVRIFVHISSCNCLAGCIDLNIPLN